VKRRRNVKGLRDQQEDLRAEVLTDASSVVATTGVCSFCSLCPPVLVEVDGSSGLTDGREK
jgi:hypothetical protein